MGAGSLTTPHRSLWVDIKGAAGGAQAQSLATPKAHCMAGQLPYMCISMQVFIAQWGVMQIWVA